MGLNVRFVNYSVALCYPASAGALMIFPEECLMLCFQQKVVSPQAIAVCFQLGCCLFALSGLMWASTPNEKNNRVKLLGFSVATLLLLVHSYVPLGSLTPLSA